MKVQTSRFRPQNLLKQRPGNKHEKNTYVGPRCPKSSQNEVPKSTKNRYKSKPGPQGVLRVSPGLPGSPQWSPRVPKWRHQACQMTAWEPKVNMSVSKKTVIVITSNTFQQINLENNYLKTNIQKDNYFCSAPCQSCMSCQSKSAGKPTSKPVRKPASQKADQQVASHQASSQQARSCQRGPAAGAKP